MSAQFNDIQMNDQTQPQQSYPSYLSIPKIRVIVRKRPLSKKELSKNDTDVVDIRNHRQVIVKELKTKVDLTKFIEEHTFKFDLAFNEQTTNEQIYIETVRPMIEAAFNKTKVTCFAYGQTGSGKTYYILDVLTPGHKCLYLCDTTRLKKGIIKELEMKNGQVLWPIRTAISGKQFTPGGAIEIAFILGKDETLRRIQVGIDRLSEIVEE